MLSPPPKDLIELEHETKLQELEQLISTPQDDTQKLDTLSSLIDCCNKAYRLFNQPHYLEKAIYYQAQEIPLNPNKPDPYVSLGMLFHEKFKLSHLPEDGRNAVSNFNHALLQLEQDDHNVPKIHIHKALAYHALFTRSGDQDDIDNAIDSASQAVSLSSDTDQSKLMKLNVLAGMHHARYEGFEKLADVDQAIECLHRAESLISVTHPSLPQILSNLGTTYECRFERLGDKQDIDLAIEYASRALSLVDEDSPRLPARLNSLGIPYTSRYKAFGNRSDVESAINLLGRALLLTPENHPERPSELCCLGNCFEYRFEKDGTASDSDRALELFSQAVDQVSIEDPYRGHLLNNLGNSYSSRFNHFGNALEIEKAIEYLSLAVSLTHNSHSSKPFRLTNLAAAFVARFKKMGRVSDLNAAIDCASNALAQTPGTHSTKPMRFHSLGNTYHLRFERFGDPTDIQHAIEYFNQAVNSIGGSPTEKAIQLSSLGNSYEALFKYSRQIPDIDVAINHLGKAVQLLSEGDQYLPGVLYNLGSALHSRFQRLNELSDIDKAIDSLHRAVTLTPENHLDKLQRLKVLSICCFARFESLRDLKDIDKSIEFGEQAICMLSNTDTSDVSIRDSLGNAYRARFDVTKRASDINTAIHIQTDGLSLAPGDHVARPALINNLANSYQSRFIEQNTISDIDKCIDYRRQALELAKEQADRPTLYLNLGSAYEHRFLATSMISDIQEAIKYFHTSSISSSGHPRLRLKAARKCGRLSFQHEQPLALEAYKVLMELIPQVIWIGASLDHRYQQINSLEDVAVESAMVAISLGDHNLALEWLEEGRSIVWSQMLHIRSPLDSLRLVDEMLAEELEHTARELSSAQRLWTSDASLNVPISEESSQQQRSQAVRWDELLSKARQIPGFEYFLKPKKAAEIMKSATSTTIVVINVHYFRCDALILTPGCAAIKHIPLPLLSFESCIDIKTSQLHLIRGTETELRTLDRISRRPFFHPDDLVEDKFQTQLEVEFEVLLGSLWTNIVEPVLDFLGYKDPKSPEELPRVTWCATGPLAFAPIHAAGLYSSESPRTFDFIISSYTPTLGSLLNEHTSSMPKPSIVAIGQAATSGQSPLPGTIDELDEIEKASQKFVFTRIEGEQATPSNILNAMQNHSWVHLACHASQATDNPSASAFHLHGGELSLSAISQAVLEKAEFAFLSACQTATGHEGMPEEAVHLAGGMLVAGFPAVVATMWSIYDEDASILAGSFYSELLREEEPDRREFARALHNAVGGLRSKVGERRFTRWVPFIHLGR